MEKLKTRGAIHPSPKELGFLASQDKCKYCGSEYDVHAHHIIPWKLCEEKRFDLENGITLCRSCHSKTERNLEMKRGQFNLKNTR
jgi:5-methylcytosine-specific restriction endonuclease McrA